MTRDDALAHIRAALATTGRSNQVGINEATDLVESGVLDSLDVMNFLFQLEKRLGVKLKSIDMDYNDFRVSSLVDVIQKDAR